MDEENSIPIDMYDSSDRGDDTLLRYRYRLASNELSDTQFILIDSELVEPLNKKLSFTSRYMDPEDPDNPPLISYYTGP